VLEEVTFGWPRQKADLAFKEQLAINLQNAFNSVTFASVKLNIFDVSIVNSWSRKLFQHKCFHNFYFVLRGKLLGWS
jgi:hypothetical protein